MKLALATDAWFPQINGVVRSLSTTVEELERRAIDVLRITPQQFLTIPMPGYRSIRMALAPRFGLRRRLDGFGPDIVHIATEGPIGWSARRWCLDNKVPFTTSFHTRFPEYASVRTGLSVERFWPIMVRFHARSEAVLVATESLSSELAGRGIAHTHRWSRGIDHTLFTPEGSRHPEMTCLKAPVLLYVGRVAPEKNLDAFLDLEFPGTKVIVGDGPSLATMRQRYPDAVFLGALSGDALASTYRSADCFVFPSLTDTFGLVVIEALACGLPVAAFPVTGPIDILGADGKGPDGNLPGAAGVVHEDLAQAIAGALSLDPRNAARLGAQFSWEHATDQFLGAIQKVLSSVDYSFGAGSDLKTIAAAG